MPRLRSIPLALVALALLIAPSRAVPKKPELERPFAPKPLEDALRLNPEEGLQAKGKLLRADAGNLLRWTYAANATLSGAKAAAEAMAKALKRAGCIHHRLGAKAPKELPDKCGEPLARLKPEDIVYFKNQLVYFQDIYKILRMHYSGAQGISRRLETLAGAQGEVGKAAQTWRLTELCAAEQGTLIRHAKEALDELPRDGAAAARKNLEQIRDFCPQALAMHKAAQAWIAPVMDAHTRLDALMRFYYVGAAEGGRKSLNAKGPTTWYIHQRLTETAAGKLALDKVREELDKQLEPAAWDRLIADLTRVRELRPPEGDAPPAYKYEHAAGEGK